MTNKEFFIKSWERESAVTAKGIRSLPDVRTKLNIRHYPKFRSPWEIVNHIGAQAKVLCQAFTEGKWIL
jgi:hypothetical protein